MRIPVLTSQIMRFFTIGVMNTGVDFLILNCLILLFGLENEDPRYIMFKVISFTLAATNSFFWNRGWVFKKESMENKKMFRELLEFFSVSALSFIINIGVATTVYHSGGTYFPDIKPVLWANIGAIAGALVSFGSNFFGYKFFVFKK